MADLKSGIILNDGETLVMEIERIEPSSVTLKDSYSHKNAPKNKIRRKTAPIYVSEYMQ